MAYALFKQSIKEDHNRGMPRDTAYRDPSQTAVNTYREAASQRLTAFAATVVEEQTPAIQERGLVESLKVVEANIKEHVTIRTSSTVSIMNNVLAWVVVAGITILGVWLINRGDIPTAVSDKVMDAPSQP